MITETCPKCGVKCMSREEVRIVRSYSKCSKCLLEERLGHPYVPTYYTCVCGKKFLHYEKLSKHKLKFNCKKDGE